MALMVLNPMIVVVSNFNLARMPGCGPFCFATVSQRLCDECAGRRQNSTQHTIVRFLRRRSHFREYTAFSTWALQRVQEACASTSVLLMTVPYGRVDTISETDAPVPRLAHMVLTTPSLHCR